MESWPMVSGYSPLGWAQQACELFMIWLHSIFTFSIVCENNPKDFI